jgi:SAM-dependent methyltransferase
MRSRADYGIDSPAIVTGLFLVGAVSLAAALLLHVYRPSHPVAEVALSAAGAYFVLGAGGMVWYSKVSKLAIRDQILDQARLHGWEVVLDVGCGRGLLLVGAARRLSTGKAVGLDRWIRGALTNNRPGSAIDNARLEGASERAQVTRGDIRQLPFADASFDVALSNFVVHEVNTAADRERILREIVRVLKPGGRLALVDFIFTAECVRVLQAVGVVDAKRVRAGSSFAFWLGALLNFGLVQTYVVTGTKPSAAAPIFAGGGVGHRPGEAHSTPAAASGCELENGGLCSEQRN